MATMSSKIAIPDQVIYSQVAGELVLLNLNSGKYYGLDEVGARMYNLLVEYGCLEPAYQTLLAEYDVDGERLQSDLIHLVDHLVENKLLQIIEK